MSAFSVSSVVFGTMFGMMIDGFFASYGGLVLKKQVTSEAGSPPHARLTILTDAGEVEKSVPATVYRSVRVGDRLEKPEYRWSVVVNGKRHFVCRATVGLGLVAVLISVGAVVAYARYGTKPA